MQMRNVADENRPPLQIACEPRGRDRQLAGPEGATAPETLRETDREGNGTLESALVPMAPVPPKE